MRLAGLETRSKVASRGLEKGFKGASMLEKALKVACLKGASRGLEKGFKGASRGASRRLEPSTMLYGGFKGARGSLFKLPPEGEAFEGGLRRASRDLEKGLKGA